MSSSKHGQYHRQSAKKALAIKNVLRAIRTGNGRRHLYWARQIERHHVKMIREL